MEDVIYMDKMNRYDVESCGEYYRTKHVLYINCQIVATLCAGL